MEQITLSANAKINLTLDVTGRRSDGYHSVEMIMQSISLSDQVRIRKNDSGVIRLSCSREEIPCDDRNTAYRAAQLFLQNFGIRDGLDMEIKKKIPSQAGLGGGSADAAAVLVGLNRLYKYPASNQILLDFGVKVGADVPFCIAGGTMLCEGIGEILTTVPPLPMCHILLCKPEVNISTREAYEQIDRGSITQRPDQQAFLCALDRQDLNAAAALLSNVFESAVPNETICSIRKQILNSGALGACMSGSGSTVYGFFSDDITLKAAMNQLLKEYREVHSAVPVKQGVEILSEF